MWSEILSGATSLFQSKQQEKAGDTAVAEQARATDLTIAEAGRQFDTVRADTQLQREMGNQALLALGYLTGIRTPPSAKKVGSLQSRLASLQGQLQELEGQEASAASAEDDFDAGDWFKPKYMLDQREQWKDFKSGNDPVSRVLHPGESAEDFWMGGGGAIASSGSLTVDKQRLQSEISSLQQQLTTAEMDMNMAGQLGAQYVPTEEQVQAIGTQLEQAKADLEKAQAGQGTAEAPKAATPAYQYNPDLNAQENEAASRNAFYSGQQAGPKADAAITQAQNKVTQLQQQYDQAQTAFSTAGDSQGEPVGGVPDLNTLFDDIDMPDVPVLPSIESYLDGLGQDLENSRGYQFELKQGREALQNIASQQGTAYGGNQIKAALEYSQNFASTKYAERFQQAIQEYGVKSAETVDQYNLERGAAVDKYGMTLDKYNLAVQKEDRQVARLSSLAGMGSVGANTSAAAGAGYASTVANALDKQASTAGNVAYATANARSEAVGTTANNAMTMYQYNKMMKDYNQTPYRGAPQDASINNDYRMA